ncbi:MAG: hypothetical protein GQ564_15740 [Bacteroidales bacterium]|nr:hypothetical protein [Bacteroidales bacterium]
MNTNFYISKKLEKTVPVSLINNVENSIINPLDKWNANIFHVSHKKCWIITNSITKYTILLDRIAIVDLPKLSEIFAQTFYEQLQTDNIETNFHILQEIIGQISLFSTDNDQKIIGTQNSILVHLENWKYEFGHIDNWPFRKINRRLNEIPYKQTGWILPKEKMNEVLNTIV